MITLCVAFVVAAVAGVAIGCIAFVLFTDDAVAASGDIEEGQVW